jgi:polyhydroxyalkanoate synthesis regulator phasin
MEADARVSRAYHWRRMYEGAATVLNNRFAREALKQAATQVNQGVRDGAKQFVEREVTPLRERIDELEGRVARLERQVSELLRERSGR